MEEREGKREEKEEDGRILTLEQSHGKLYGRIRCERKKIEGNCGEIRV